MNIAGTQFPVFNPYNGKIAFEIYVSGCDNYCIGCHNPELQDFNYGTPLDIYLKGLLKHMREVKNMFNVIAILGGDLHSHGAYEGSKFIMTLRSYFKGKEFWLFTGSEFNDLFEYEKDMFHVIKTGKYIQALHQDGFPSSSNQKLLYKGVDY